MFLGVDFAQVGAAPSFLLHDQRVLVEVDLVPFGHFSQRDEFRRVAVPRHQGFNVIQAVSTPDKPLNDGARSDPNLPWNFLGNIATLFVDRKREQLVRVCLFAGILDRLRVVSLGKFNAAQNALLHFRPWRTIDVLKDGNGRLFLVEELDSCQEGFSTRSLVLNTVR
jgi:hypothetical protein